MDIGYTSCELCPRMCRIDRTRGELGWCREGDRIRLAFGGLHFGEEPPISEPGGSGTLFFSGCPLGCPTCQNIQISSGNPPLGRAVSEHELSDICLNLQHQGAQNINLVTGTHYIPSLVSALERARQQGLTIPIVWNSSGFERIEALEMIHDLIDIYLMDLKTLDQGTARRFCGISWYPEVAKQTLPWVIANRPKVYSGDRLVQGVIIRHLVLPDAFSSTREVLAWVAGSGGEAVLSVMQQFADPQGVLQNDPAAEAELLGLLDACRIEDGFIQELGDDTLWLPDFTRPNPFPHEYCVPLWHWNDSTTQDR